MKSINYSRLVLELLLLALVIFLGLRSCDVKELEERVKRLNQNETVITSERDSIIQLLNVKSLQYDTIYAKYNSLTDELKKATQQYRSLTARYYQRGEQLKKVNSDYEALSRNLTAMNAENDSLRNEISNLFRRFAECEGFKYAADSLNTQLAQSLKEKEEKILADSLAEANKPIPPKESGFVSINELGGGFGLGNTAVDYSKSLLGVSTIAAYRINQHFITGFGTGLSLYDGGTMVPLYLDFRYILRERKFTPFVVADGGFLFVTKDFSASGIFINPAIGATRKVNEKITLHLSSGLLLQAAPAGPPSGGFRRSFINIKGGISFMGK
ncbi:MAG TPA: hypothetical protein VMV47_06140 [Bacteroidales bacterium]|nr:hypothetical protein [Bacteroidales bacterium]